MRNLFDQYKEPENRLTHALMTVLHEDRALLSRFIKWATGKPAPSPLQTLTVLEQSLPGEEELQDVEDQERKGLPDGCIHDDNGWALLIESKIAARLTMRQIKAHQNSARSKRLDRVTLLALTATGQSKLTVDGVTCKEWRDLYIWLKQHARSSYWVSIVTDYMEVAEMKLSRCGYLTMGTLTGFTGVPFDKETPYTYDAAKRILDLAMIELRNHTIFNDQLHIDNKKVRLKIKGKNALSVWDVLLLKNALGEPFTSVPHLSLGIHHDQLNAFVIVPDKVTGRYRRSLMQGDQSDFCAIFKLFLDEFEKRLGCVKGAMPWIEVIQRVYPSRSAEPVVNAKLEFDLRTAFPNAQKMSPKHQKQWLETTYASMKNRRSNLQLAVGAIFPYGTCEAVRDPKILNHIADAWISCKPLITRMTSGQ